MPLERLKGFLDGNAVKYVMVRHSAAYTAQELAAKPERNLVEGVRYLLYRILDGEAGPEEYPVSLLEGGKIVFEVGFRFEDGLVAEQHALLDPAPAVVADALDAGGDLFDMGGDGQDRSGLVVCRCHLREQGGEVVFLRLYLHGEFVGTVQGTGLALHEAVFREFEHGLCLVHRQIDIFLDVLYSRFRHTARAPFRSGGTGAVGSKNFLNYSRKRVL